MSKTTQFTTRAGTSWIREVKPRLHQVKCIHRELGSFVSWLGDQQGDAEQESFDEVWEEFWRLHCDGLTESKDQLKDLAQRLFPDESE